MEKISKRQLYCLTIMNLIGSTNLWALGIDAKQDAWIVILLSMLISFPLLWIYTEIHLNFPKDNIAGIITSLLGKIIGWPLAFLYVIFYLFDTTRNISEFGDLIHMTFLVNTPSWIIMFMLIATIMYILFLRIENFARLTELLMPIIFLAIVSVYIMTVASGLIDLKQLTPVLANGVTPVLKASYPVIVNFPFAGTFIFIQLWKFVEPKECIRKITFISVGLSGVLLAATIVIIISVLGVNLAANSTIPLLKVIRLINIANIITNLDAIGVMLIFISGFYRAALILFAAATTLSVLFKVEDYRWFLIPLGFLLLWYANIYEPNYPFHVKFLLPQYKQQFIPLYDLIPLFLFLIMKLKKYSKSEA
jgi:spore germination protein KB